MTLSDTQGSAVVELATGNVSFRNAAGQVVLGESGPPTFAPVTAEGKPDVSVTQQFNRGTDEGFYGLGQHQNRQMNYNGEDVELAQHNMDVAVPFLVSTRNYGLLWDNNSITPLRRSRALRSWRESDQRRHAAGPPTYIANGKTASARAAPSRRSTIQYLEDRKRLAGRAPAPPTWPTPCRQTSGRLDRHASRRAPAARTTSGSIRRAMSRSSSTASEVLDRWRQNWNPWYHNFDARR